MLQLGACRAASSVASGLITPRLWVVAVGRVAIAVPAAVKSGKGSSSGSGKRKAKAPAKADLPSKICAVCGRPFTW
jgi:Uncharacterized protein conserved in bacteria (DUF2256)